MRKLSIAILAFVTYISICSEANANQTRYTLDEDQELVSCDIALEACGQALQEASELLKSQDEMIQLKGRQIDGLAERVATLQSERDSIWRNPWFWFAAGIIIGGTSAILLEKLP